MTPRRRPNGYYQYRKRLPGRGYVARTLATKSKRSAVRREAAIDALVERGRMDLVGGWLDGKLELVELIEAYESGRLDRLTRTLESAHVPPLGEACDGALNARKAHVRPSTLERYRDGMNRLREFHGERARLSDVMEDEAVGAFTAHRLESVKPGTVNKDLQALSILATYAESKGWIATRPTIKKLRVDPRTVWIGPTEIATYMAELRPAFRPVMAFLLGTGCRLGEAERLRVQDVTLEPENQWAHIRRSKTSAGVRSVPLSRDLVDMIQARIEDEGLAGSDRVFQPIPRRTVQKEHRDAAKRAGLPKDYTIHRHRDTFAVTVAKRGMPLPTLQRILGHKNIQQTMKYAGYHPSYSDARAYLGDDPSGTDSGPPRSEGVGSQAPDMEGKPRG